MPGAFLSVMAEVFALGLAFFLPLAAPVSFFVYDGHLFPFILGFGGGISKSSSLPLVL